MIDMHAHWKPAELIDALRARTKEPRIVRNQDGVEMHVDHNYLLSLSSNGLTPKVPVCARLFANHRAIYFNRHSEASAFPHPCCWAGV